MPALCTGGLDSEFFITVPRAFPCCCWSCEPLAWTNCLPRSCADTRCFVSFTPRVYWVGRAGTLCNDIGKEGFSFLSSKVHTESWLLLGPFSVSVSLKHHTLFLGPPLLSLWVLETSEAGPTFLFSAQYHYCTRLSIKLSSHLKGDFVHILGLRDRYL